MMRRIVFLVAMTAIVLACTAGTALAYTDYVPYLSKQTTGTASTEAAYALGCFWCHGWDKQAAANTSDTVNVMQVLTAPAGTLSAEARWTNIYQQYGQPYGPHGGYSNTTDRCKVCHDTHAANGDIRLLPAASVADLCETCHDFTEGISIYGAIRAQTGQAPAAGHFVYGLQSSENSATALTGTLVPGGQFGTADAYFPQTGGTVAYTSLSLASQEQHLTCTDCHTPHGNTAMRPFKGDRVRLGSAILVAACNIQPAQITKTAFTSAVAVPALRTVGLGAVLDAGDHVLAGTSIPASLPISPNSPIYAQTAYCNHEISPAGVALALTLNGAGALDLHFEATSTAVTPYGVLFMDANLTRVPSNKLLRDYLNNVDLRNTIYGGQAPANNNVTYNETLGQWDPVLGTGGTYSPNALEGGAVGDPAALTAANAPWMNGQNNARAEYGSGFCSACHQGRIGNWVGGAQLDADFAYTGTASRTNHPTNMKIAYRNVGTLANGLALSNQGFVMEPVAATNHPDGVIARQDAPICQQCHEDARDCNTRFSYTDTDKTTPFSATVNGVLGITGGSFIYAGNPQFQNFPHETLNGRLLVEGGDSSRPATSAGMAGGGGNDNLCLNCHVPGSTYRYNGAQGAVKDLNGFME